MDEETLTVWLDTALLMLAGFVLMSVLMMSVMNPPTQSSESDNVLAPGNVIIEAQWGDKLAADVDLWVQAPGDVPVGYSNKGGAVFNLLRDDSAGTTTSPTSTLRSPTRAGRLRVNMSSMSTCTAAETSPIRSPPRSSPA
jgi:hypothetical protein